MKSGVTLRGAGTGSTIINSSANNAIYFAGYDCMIFYNGANGGGVTRVNWTNNYTQGTNTIYLDSTSGLSVGQNIWVDQNNDGDTSALGLQQAGNITGGCYSTPSYPTTGQDRYQFQMDLVTAINGNQVTLSEPLYMPNWNSTNSPQAWWENVGFPMQWAGCEDFTLACSAGTGNSLNGIMGLGLYACWLRNVSLTTYRYYTPMQVGMRCEVRHCTITGPNSTDDYGYYPKLQFGTLYADNIGNACGSVFLIQSCSGCVFAYNYSTNLMSQSGYLTAGILPHGGNPSMLLFEGNWAPNFGMDNTWGSAAYNTGFRNRLVGTSDSAIAADGNTEAVQLSAVNRHMSLLGNVLGTSGYNTIYQETVTSCTGNPRVYFFGGNSGCSGTDDPLVRSTAILEFNWDAYTQGIVTNLFAGVPITDSQMPASLYLTSAPTNFGILRWPPVDPLNVAYSISRTNIPAGYRSVYGVDPPASSVALMPPPFPPIVPATFSAKPTIGSAPLTVQFTSGAQWGTNSLLSFGDGSNATNVNPSHVYSSDGVFTVTLYNVLPATNQAVVIYYNYITVTN
jgi:PKD repeat protein